MEGKSHIPDSCQRRREHRGTTIPGVEDNDAVAINNQQVICVPNLVWALAETSQGALKTAIAVEQQRGESSPQQPMTAVRVDSNRFGSAHGQPSGCDKRGRRFERDLALRARNLVHDADGVAPMLSACADGSPGKHSNQADFATEGEGVHSWHPVWLTVVGVVAEATHWSMPRGEQNEIYVP
jgi:hypothetical protein